MSFKWSLPLVLMGLMMPSLSWANTPKITLESLPSIKLKSPVLGGVLVEDIDRNKRVDVIVNQFAKGLVLLRYKDGKETKVAEVAAVTGRGAPSAGDIDGDGKMEVLVGAQRYNTSKKANEHGILVLNHKFEQKGFWPLPGPVSGSVVLRDLDSDKRMEAITTTSNGFLIVLDANGKSRKGFPIKVDHTLDQSEVIKLPTPAVGELDGDRSNGPEIVIATTGGSLHAFFRDGKSLPAYPIKLGAPSFASPQIGDFDGDGKGEILAVTSIGTIERRLPDGTSAAGFPVALKSYTTATPVIVDLDRDGKREIYVATHKGMIHGLGLDGKKLLGWPRSVRMSVSADLLVADVDGDAEMELLVATQGGTIAAFEKKGLFVHGYPKRVAVSIYATPAVADVTHRGQAHWIVPCQSRKLHVVRDPRPLIRDLRHGSSWLAFQGGSTRQGSLDNVTIKAQLRPAPPKKEEKQPPTPKNEEQTPPRTSSGCHIAQSNDTKAPSGTSWLLGMFLLLLWGARRKSTLPPKM